MKFVGEVSVRRMKNDERLSLERRKRLRNFGLERVEFRVEFRGVRLEELGVFRGRFAEGDGRLSDKLARDGGARPNVRVKLRVRTRMRVRRMSVGGFGLLVRMRVTAGRRKEFDVFAKVDLAGVRHNRRDVFSETFFDGETDAEEKSR